MKRSLGKKLLTNNRFDVNNTFAIIECSLITLNLIPNLIVKWKEMPPKKKESAKDDNILLLGRVGTSLKIGIVGLPNVGLVVLIYTWLRFMLTTISLRLQYFHRKSTFFNVLTKSQAAAENFPFCTIDPNENKYLPHISHLVPSNNHLWQNIL